jgi:hypothetical protein
MRREGTVGGVAKFCAGGTSAPSVVEMTALLSGK